MNTIKILNQSDYHAIKKFIEEEGSFFNFFINLGWSIKEIKKNLDKKTNYSIGYFHKDSLKALLFGDIIEFDNKLELEIFLVYVSHKYRRNKIATKLLQFIEKNKKISKIFLEVKEDNYIANRLYEKNSFDFLKFRHNYYKNNSKLNKAKCYIKKINYE